MIILVELVLHTNFNYINISILKCVMYIYVDWTNRYKIIIQQDKST